MTQAVRHEEMRARNLEVVLGAVGRGGPLTRAALAEVTGLTKSTVSKLVGDLVEAGLLAETGPARAGERGRPGVELVLSGARVASLGLEVNVDYLAVRVLDLTGEVRVAARRDRDNRGSRPKKVLGELQDLAAEALAEAHRLGLEAAGAVLAVSGPVGDGVLFSAPNLGWQDVRPADLLRLPVPVELDNEANLAALGELWYGDGERDFLYVSGEIGIGAGLVVGGVLYSGATGLAGELGHVVVAPDGEWVASCCVWLDTATGVALVEPVGCVEEHGRKGLATAASVSALTAARDAGATTGLVCPRGDDDYPGPARLYQRIGFAPGARTRTYRRRRDG